MSKIYTASMLRRPASPRSDKLKAVAGGSSSSSHSSSSSSSIVPAAADSVFWKYFGLDENGDLYVKKKEDEEPRSLWTYGNLVAGGAQSDEEPSPSPSVGSSVSWDQRYPSTGERIAIISIDGQDINVYAPKAPVAGTDYLTPAAVQSAIDATVNPISALIPSAATAQNQLADKAFVNSSIASNTGAFKGTFSSTSQLPSTNVNTNDYAFVTSTDANNNTVYNRYKYNGTRWVFEYALNNSSFTAAQWSAINSGITAQKVAGYDTLVSNVQADWNATTGLAAILNKPTSLPASDVYSWAKAATKPSYAFSEIGSKPDTLSGYGITDAKFSSAGSGVTDKVRITLGNTSNDVLTQHQSLAAYLTSVDASSTYQTKLNATTNKLDPTYIATNSTHRWWTDDLASSLSGKADASALSGYVPTSRKVNGHALSSDVTVSASDVGLGNVTNLAASGYFTALSNITTGTDANKISVTIGGTTKKLTVAYATSAGSAASADRLTGNNTYSVWGVDYWQNGAPKDVTGRPNLYIGTTKVQTSSVQQDLAGIGSITAAGALTLSTTKKIWFGNTYFIELDDNNRLHTNADFYSDGAVAAGGVGSSSGGSGGGSSLLRELNDVYHSNSEVLRANGNSVSVGDVLTYNGPNLGWVAAPPAATVTESTVAGWGFTKNAGTITGIKMNSVSKGTSGVVDLGTVLTSVGFKAGGNSGTGNAQTTNGNTYLKLVVNGAYQEGVRIVGAQNVEVTSNAQGKITVTGPDLSTYVVWPDLDATLLSYQPLLEAGVDYIEPSTLNNYLTTVNAASTYLAKTNFLFDIRSKNTLGQQNLNTVYDPSFGDYYGRFRYYSYVGSVGTNPNATAGTNGFPTDSNANALLTMDTYSDPNSLHLFQVGFSGNGNVYYRKGAAVKQNGSWVNPWNDGHWNKIVAEDYNGDVTIGGHLSVNRGKRVKFDTSGTAYMALGSSGDNAFYINAGNGTYPVYYETSALLPGTSAPDSHSLGNNSYFWGSVHAKRWYPNPGDSSHYIEYVTSGNNGYFYVHGDFVVSGAVVAGQASNN